MKRFRFRPVTSIGRKGGSLLVAILAIAATVGCQGVADPRTSVNDSELARALEVETQAPRWNEAGQLIAQATIVNRTGEPVHILVQTTFFNGDGESLEGNPPWENVLVPEYGSRTVRRESIAEGATEYRVQMRPGVQH